MNKGPLKILHIITELNDGGAEGALYRLCINDRQNAHRVVSLMDGGKYGPLLAAAGVDVHCLGMSPGRLSWRGVVELWRIVRGYRPDAVQTWLYHADLIGGAVARLAGSRNVCWGIRHSNLSPTANKRGTILVARLSALLSRWLPQQIVCCSQQAMGRHVELGYRADKFRVIPNGYDLTQLIPDPAARHRLRAALEIADDVTLLGMVARFDRQKDHANLIGALGLLKRQGFKFRCALIGRGMTPDNRTLRQLIDAEEVADRILLLGPRNDIPAVMSMLDVHVLSSLGEAFPNVLAESMACGTPCVTTDVGDAAMIVGDTGWLAPPGSAVALAQAIGAALRARADQSAWRRRQRAARSRIEDNFSIERVVQMYRASWQETSLRHAPAPRPLST